MRNLFFVFGITASVANALPRASSDQHGHGKSQSGSNYWYANVKHNGLQTGPTIDTAWPVFRNVLDYGAKGDGKTDDTAAIQKAINVGGSNGTRDTGKFGSTGQPAVVFFPPGTYLTSKVIQNYIGTVLMGDPLSRPSIKACSDFNGSNLIIGGDPHYGGLNSFYHEMKNLVFDSTAMPSNANMTLVDWGVSQASQISNSLFLMPEGATHVGIASGGQNSPLILQDLDICGGGVGWTGSSTQYHFKNVHFKGVKTGIKPTNTVQISVQGCQFEDVGIAVDISNGTMGLLNMFDSKASNTQILVSVDANMTNSQGSIMLENVDVCSTVPITVKAGSSTLLAGSVEPGNTWIRGHIFAGDSASTTPEMSIGRMVTTSRPSALVNTEGAYYTVTPPTYQEYTVEQIINIKDVPAHPVHGDGIADDTASIQAILHLAAQTSKIVYFPSGIYILTSTLYIPPNSRLWGESFCQLSGRGSFFKDPLNLQPIIRVGHAGETGLAQFTDLMLTVAEVLPGAIILEVNMAGSAPGDVGFFNTHFRIGGAKNNLVSQCPTIEDCKAVHLGAHLTPSSSSYWENSWAWTADLDLDGEGFGAYPAPAGGFLIESTRGSWFLGWGVEHFVLYQVNIAAAKNVFIGLQQGESCRYQGGDNTILAPAPWLDSELLPTDPSFSWCPADDVKCRMSIYQHVSNSSSINLYSGGFWNFVAGPNRTFCVGDCQDNAVFYEHNEKLFSYGISTINDKNLILESGPGGSDKAVVATRLENQGSKKDIFDTGVMAAYLRQSG